ncbi:hypothetical protein [Chamaesiphon minutus]|uniref:Uncharacterized protein n=1 Tax=Chamaesiphon minutus (strain ATCC 27169 / PCC 6605) TaxID=1173020 RepID=K9USM0_CHAP6|nr:hypothetical protein [Chamaesiphon minutus]AFY97254.1 hypothetical protein Cha6605_6439 [Chamaesiphon minutus PCC 6605]
MVQKYLIGIGFLLITSSAILIIIIRYRRNQKLNLTFQEAFDLALAIFSGMSGAYVIYQAINLLDTLLKLVGIEGIVAMCLGGLASIWFAFGKIKELIDKP